jgi:hypothetical protein
LKKELRAVLEPSDGAEVCLLDGGISDLHEAASHFQSEIDLVQCEMDRFAECYRAEGEGPVEVLERLLEDGREMTSGLEEDLRSTMASTRNLLEFFGERRVAELPQGGCSNETFVAVEKFFSTIREFVVSFEECWREVLENPRKLRLEGFVTSTAAAGAKEASKDASDTATSIPAPTFITKQSPKAAAAAACAAQAANIISERRAKVAASSDAPSDSQCATQVGGLAVEAASAAMRRRKTTGILRLGGPDFGAARLLPAPAAPSD